MANDDILGFEIEDEEEFDPFSDDAPEDDEGIEEMPMVSELPEQVRRHGAYDADKYGCAEDAIESLMSHNPGRRPVFLKIIEYCTEPRTESEVAAVVDAAQASNASVYGPATLCRMLERSGALTCEVPETADEVVEDDGTEYLEIKEAPEARWTATDAGLAVAAAHREGGPLRELLAREAQYEPVYRKLLAFCAAAPRTKKEIDALIDGDPLVQRPRRYSNHFVELLESREALAWVDGRWTLTELGERFWNEMKDAEGAPQAEGARDDGQGGER